MNKYKVGDLVKGITRAESGMNSYTVTNENMLKAKVVEAYGDGDIRINIVEHTNRSYVGSSYTVKGEAFVPYEEPKIEAASGVTVITELGKTFLVVDNKYIICVSDIPKNVGLAVCPEDTKFNLEIGKSLSYYRQNNNGLEGDK